MLSSIGFATMTAFRDALAPYDVHPRQFAVLRALSESDGASQRTIADALHMPPSRLVALVDDLEARGLAERHPDPSDRRAHCLYLTESGRELLGQLFVAVGEYEKRLFAGLSKKDRATLDRLLLKVGSSLGLGPGEHPGMRGLR